MGLFGISRDLQNRVCNPGEPSASSHMGRRMLLMEDKARWEGLVNRILGFSLAESLPGKKSNLLVALPKEWIKA